MKTPFSNDAHIKDRNYAAGIIRQMLPATADGGHTLVPTLCVGMQRTTLRRRVSDVCRFAPSNGADGRRSVQDSIPTQSVGTMRSAGT